MRIGVSVSDSSNLARLGLAAEHVEDDMVEITRYLLAVGATVVYGGDLRATASPSCCLKSWPGTMPRRMIRSG